MWVGEQLGFAGEFGAEKEFGPRWRWHLARTLYCREALFVPVVMYAQQSLEFYGGIPFALKEAWEYFDAQAANVDEQTAKSGVPSQKMFGW